MQVDKQVIANYEIASIDPNPPQNYYMIIPVPVLLDCGSSAAILYGVIVSLTNNKGFCYASNEYLSSKANMSFVTTKRCLVRLKKHGFIRIVLETYNQRKIFTTITEQTTKVPSIKKILPPVSKRYSPQYQIDTHSNKVSNKENNSIKNLPVKKENKILTLLEVENVLKSKECTQLLTERFGAAFQEGTDIQEMMDWLSDHAGDGKNLSGRKNPKAFARNWIKRKIEFAKARGVDLTNKSEQPMTARERAMKFHNITEADLKKEKDAD